MKFYKLGSLFILVFFSIMSCRNHPFNLSDSKGDLSVSISVNRNLYDGNILPGARFIDLSSDSLTLSCTIDSTVYSASVTLEEDTENPDTYSGTAVISDLPADVTATINVETFNVDSILVCEGSDNIELKEGENKLTLTLHISDESPLLTIADTAEYAFKSIPAGESRFFRIGPLTAGSSYSFFGDTVDDYEADVIINLVSEEGVLIPITMNSDENGFTFTATETGYAIASYYNNGTEEINGVVWWGEPSPFTEIIETNKINTTTLAAAGISVMTSNAPYMSMVAGNGRCYVASQSEGYAYTEDGSAWFYTAATDVMDPSITGDSEGITDIDEASGYIFMGVFYKIGSVPYDFYYDLAIRDTNNVFNHTPGTPFHITRTNNNNFMVSNCRISHSVSHIALADIDESDNLRISMAAINPGNIGDLTQSYVPASFVIGNNNLSIQAIENSLYLLGQSGSIYRFDSGGTSLSTSIASVDINAAADRHLTDLGFKYLVASTPQNSILHMPDLDKSITLYDDSNRSEDIQLLWDSGYTRVDNHFIGSEKYLVSVFLLEHPSMDNGLTVAVSPNGGFSWIYSDHITLSNSAVLNIVDIAMDDSLNEIYISIHQDDGNNEYKVYSLKMQ